jgi:hypothetical protein
METKFTPGPWEIADTSPNGTSVKSTSIGIGILWCGANSMYSTKESRGYTISGEEAKANAHLASAAPDMYAALEAAKAHIRDEIGMFGARMDYKDTDTINVIDAALKKARGE